MINLTDTIINRIIFHNSINESKEIKLGLINRKVVYLKDEVVIDSETDYVPGEQLPSSRVTYVNEPGVPIVSTDEQGSVTEFAYSDISVEEPVSFNNDHQDTGFKPFVELSNFELNFTVYFDTSAQSQTQATILELKRELSPYYGFTFRKESGKNNLELSATDHNNKTVYTRLKNADNIYSFKVTLVDGLLTVINKKTDTLFYSTRMELPTMNELNCTLGASFNQTTKKYQRPAICDFYEFSIIRLY